MKIKLTAFLVAGLCFALTFARAQSGKIAGRVLDNTNQPAIAATITLVKAKDSSAVKTALADVQGRFMFDKLPAGEFKLWVSAVGFQKYRSNVISISASSVAVELPVVVLTPGKTALKEVAITAQKSLIEQKIDRTVVNVGASISNTGANALEVLEKAPGVTVDDNGTISYKGKPGVMIMIDDKPTYLSGDNLANYLRSLPASVLDQIELMPNPPARYDAAGNAGVINIKTKRSKAKGFNGSLAASIGDAAYWRTNESLTLNYHEGKLNIFSNMSYTLNNNYRRLDVDRHYFNAAGNPTSSYTELAMFHPVNNNYNVKLGADYYASPKTTIGVVLTGSMTRGNMLNPVTSLLKNGAGVLDSTILAQNSQVNRFNNKGINFNYTHQFDTVGKALSFDLDHINYYTNRDQDFNNSSYNQAGLYAANQHITAHQPGHIDIYSVKTDYTNPLKNKAKLSAGLKTSYVNTDNAVNYFNVVNNISTVDNNNTNHFLYQENINAGYLNFTQDFRRFSVQAGLRAENTNIIGHQLGNSTSPDSAFTQHYTSLFPAGFVLYKLDTAGNNSLNLSYGRRIDRPNYQDLNPFIVILDKYSAFSGNPFLKPQYVNVYRFSYSYKSRVTLGLEYNVINDYQVEYDYQKGDIFFANTVNLGQRLHKSIDLNVNLDPAKWWSFYLFAEVDNNIYRGQLGATNINNQDTHLYTNGSNTFNLSHGWSAELSYMYVSPFKDSQFTHIHRSQVNTGLQKKVMNNKGAIRLGARDIFRDSFSAGNIQNVPGAQITYHNDFANRVVTLGFSYNFGTAIKDLKKHNANGAESEQRRAGS